MTAPAAARMRSALPRGWRSGAAPTRAASDRRLGYLLVAPVIILLLAITIYPLISAVWNSFHFDNLSVAGVPHKFVGLDNYKAMFGSPEWRAALERTLVFTVVTIVFDIVVATGLALMLHRKFRGRGLLRAAVLVPWAVPTVVSAMLWVTMFDPRSGFVDYLLAGFHAPWANLSWVNASVWRTWAVIFVADSWKNVPFVAILLLAGLQVIPHEVYEAARIDGASAWRSFRRITMPLLKPALSVALIFRTLQALLVFDVIFVTDQGGPGNSTESSFLLNYYTYTSKSDYGVGSAMSIMLVLIALAAAAAYVRQFRQETT